MSASGSRTTEELATENPSRRLMRSTGSGEPPSGIGNRCTSTSSRQPVAVESSCVIRWIDG